MNQLKKSFIGVIVVLGVLCAGDFALAATSPEKQLQKGIEAYRKNDTDKAMDYFVDVLMNGDAEQVARANNYIDAIHNKIGGIETPVEVDLSFPDQPTQTIVDPVNNLANYGTERLNTLATEADAVAQEAIDALGHEPKTLTEQIEARQLAGYLQNGQEPQVVEPDPQSAAQELVLDSNTVAAEQNTNGLIPTQQDLEALDEQYKEQTSLTPRDQMMTSYQVPAQAQLPSSTFTDLTSPEAIQARNLYTTQKIQSMTDDVVARLKSAKGVHLYMTADGRPDALDVDDGVLFKGNYFRSDALDTLNDIYELLALTQGAHYTILPSGSYTDDVNLAGIRQAMALKSYLVKRGISQGKLSYNMGLVDEEVPAKFSNLKGLSVVFDYDAKLPTRMLDNEGKEKNPLLSMAIVPPCRAIDRALGEAYAVDFSVLETVNPLDNWILQVVLHGRDGKYYIVRQLEGFAPVYHQILWNGRKGIIGPELPCGKYTLVLTGVDVKGNKQVLRRRVIVKCVEEKPTTGSCQTGKCPVVQQATKKATVLNYKSARLWKKPGRIMRGGEVVEQAVQTVTADETVKVQEQGAATSTEDNTYTHTKTVRNIVTTDNTPAETGSSTSYTTEEVGPAAGASSYTSVQTTTNNPYDMPYEEEYTAY